MFHEKRGDAKLFVTTRFSRKSIMNDTIHKNLTDILSFYQNWWIWLELFLPFITFLPSTSRFLEDCVNGAKFLAVHFVAFWKKYLLTTEFEYFTPISPSLIASPGLFLRTVFVGDLFLWHFCPFSPASRLKKAWNESPVSRLITCAKFLVIFFYFCCPKYNGSNERTWTK